MTMKLHKAGPFGPEIWPRPTAIATRDFHRKILRQAKRRHPDHTETISQRRLMRRLTGE